MNISTGVPALAVCSQSVACSSFELELKNAFFLFVLFIYLARHRIWGAIVVATYSSMLGDDGDHDLEEIGSAQTRIG